MSDELKAAIDRLRRIKECKETSQIIYGVDIPPGSPRQAIVNAANQVKALMRTDERLVIESVLSGELAHLREENKRLMEESQAAIRTAVARVVNEWPHGIGNRRDLEQAVIRALKEPTP